MATEPKPRSLESRIDRLKRELEAANAAANERRQAKAVAQRAELARITEQRDKLSARIEALKSDLVDADAPADEPPAEGDTPAVLADDE